jgi:hypothetical protein
MKTFSISTKKQELKISKIKVILRLRQRHCCKRYFIKLSEKNKHDYYAHIFYNLTCNVALVIQYFLVKSATFTPSPDSFNTPLFFSETSFPHTCALLLSSSNLSLTCNCRVFRGKDQQFMPLPKRLVINLCVLISKTLMKSFISTKKVRF